MFQYRSILILQRRMQVFVKLPNQAPLSVVVDGQITSADILALFQREELNTSKLVPVLGTRVIDAFDSILSQGVRRGDTIEFCPKRPEMEVELRDHVEDLFGEVRRLGDLKMNRLEQAPNSLNLFGQFLENLDQEEVIDDLELPAETNTEKAQKINCEPLPMCWRAEENWEECEPLSALPFDESFSSLEEAAHYAKKFMCANWSW